MSKKHKTPEAVVVILAFVLAGGCAKLYPARQPVVVDLDAAFDTTHYVSYGKTYTAGDQVRAGLKYWDGCGARLRTLDQLGPGEWDAYQGAPHVQVHLVTRETPKGAGELWGHYDYVYADVTLYLHDWLVPDPLRPTDSVLLQCLAAHELGHALGLQHVGDLLAVMAVELQGENSALTPADKAEFVRVNGGVCE